MEPNNVPGRAYGTRYPVRLVQVDTKNWTALANNQETKMKDTGMLLKAMAFIVEDNTATVPNLSSTIVNGMRILRNYNQDIVTNFGTLNSQNRDLYNPIGGLRTGLAYWEFDPAADLSGLRKMNSRFIKQFSSSIDLLAPVAAGECRIYAWAVGLQ
jgi:hypothetical protein